MIWNLCPMAGPWLATHLWAYHDFTRDTAFLCGIAGVTEMLLQSYLGFIHLLPALPSAWPDGKVTGLLARGGFEVDLEWSDGRLTNAVIHSRAGSRCSLRYGQTTLEFDTKQGMAYHITF